jgi:hypothetical protein
LKKAFLVTEYISKMQYNIPFDRDNLICPSRLEITRENTRFAWNRVFQTPEEAYYSDDALSNKNREEERAVRLVSTFIGELAAAFVGELAEQFG